MVNEVLVSMCSYYVPERPIKLKSIGLGSCLAIALHSPKFKAGALSHAMLPRFTEGRDKGNPGKYVDTSIYLMLDELQEIGIPKRSITAKLVGGGSMFLVKCKNDIDIGKQNIEAARMIFREEGMPIVAEDVGGSKGKSILFDISSGVVEVRVHGQKAKRL